MGFKLHYRTGECMVHVRHMGYTILHIGYTTEISKIHKYTTRIIFKLHEYVRYTDTRG